MQLYIDFACMVTSHTCKISMLTKGNRLQVVASLLSSNNEHNRGRLCAMRVATMVNNGEMLQTFGEQ